MAIKLLAPADIVIDVRENAKHPEFRTGFLAAGLRVAVAELPVGDFILLSEKEPSIVVERKTVEDFANSIRDNRVWSQGKRLAEVSAEHGLHPVIVLEGCLEDLEKYTGWRIQSVLRVMDTLILDYGIPILNTPSKDATAKWMIAKAKSLGRTESKRIVRMRTEKKSESIEDKVLYVAEGIIGPSLARKLLSHFKTLRNIANASITELMRVEGIGEARAREVFEIFNTPWREKGEGSD